MFATELKNVMKELGISQTQLAGMTGLAKSSISQYLSGRNTPPENRQEEIAVALGLEPDYFKHPAPIRKITKGAIDRLSPEEVAKLMGLHHETIRKGLQQGVFPWGYAIRTSEHKWTYFINAKKFMETERMEETT